MMNPSPFVIYYGGKDVPCVGGVLNKDGSPAEVLEAIHISVIITFSITVFRPECLAVDGKSLIQPDMVPVVTGDIVSPPLV